MIRQFSTLLLCASLAACDNSSNNDSNAPSTGRLMINGVEGLNYVTQSQSGTTDANGEFKYYPGETISFSLGNLPLAADIPAKQFLTFLEFPPAQRIVLEQGVVEEGLTVHDTAEKNALTDSSTNNLVRALILFDEDKSVKSDKKLKFTERTITQLNTALQSLPAEKPVDFSIAVTELTADNSWLNTLLASVCFYEATDERCETAPTQDEIDALKATDEKAAKELENKRTRIANGKRNTGQVLPTVIDDYVTEQANIITTEVSLRYAMLPYSVTLPATNQSLQKARVYAPRVTLSIADMQVKSNNDNIVMVQRFDKATGEIEFFATGAAGEETEIVVNFKVTGDYRWIRKTIRVRLT
ncbi:MAG: hypothetical protein H7A00_08480 [Hahellaceae bacterium]|nr:hypothetical protein [Hahellaceae bacterium]